MFRFGFMIAMVAAALIAAPAKAQAAAPDGIWLTQAGDAKVRVSKCGAGICGVVVWLRDPIDPATGKAQVDDKNPNPALARRPIIGLSLFAGMRPTGPEKWSGQIYNADDGKSYASSVSVAGPDALKVEGCVGGGLCGGETWNRATNQLALLVPRSGHLAASRRMAPGSHGSRRRKRLLTMRKNRIKPVSPLARLPPRHSRRARRR
jgi:uncharacterized protein (DUF2147 family)